MEISKEFSYLRQTFPVQIIPLSFNCFFQFEDEIIVHTVFIML